MPAMAGSLPEEMGQIPFKIVIPESHPMLVEAAITLCSKASKDVAHMVVTMSGLFQTRVLTPCKHRNRIWLKQNSSTLLGRYHSRKHQARLFNSVENDLEELWSI
jgi:hypothetical protein